MSNSPSQMIPDMLDWKQIWRSGRPRKGSNSAETVLWHPCRMRPNIVLLKNGSWEPLPECQHMWLQDVMDIQLGFHGATDQPCIVDNAIPYHPISCGSGVSL
ncbi:hypothetical protein TNCV_4385131 [Trichonephila clavipes]|nr:hypothetical protein TNCV_4385131 [Trichonephila clavipes]